jgi:hypothetical protein
MSFKEFVQDLSHDDLKQIHFHYAIQSMIECFIDDGQVDTVYLEEFMVGYDDTSSLSDEVLATIIVKMFKELNITQCDVTDIAQLITEEYSDILLQLNNALND